MSKQLQYGQIQIFEEPSLDNEVSHEKSYGPALERALRNHKKYTPVCIEKGAKISIGMVEVPELNTFAYFFESVIGGFYPKSSIYLADSHVKPCIIEAKNIAERMNFAGEKQWKIKNGLWIPTTDFVVLEPIPKDGKNLFTRVLEELVVR